MKSLVLLILFFVTIQSNIFASSDIIVNDDVKDVSVQVNKSIINLKWKLLSPAETYKFIIFRKKNGEENFEKIAQVLTRDNISSSKENDLDVNVYEFRDKLKENGVYIYEIHALNLSGTIIDKDQIKIGVSEIPEFSLKQNSPNPFNPTTIINYELYKASTVMLTVYDLSGKQIEVLKNEFQQPGSYSIMFDVSKHIDLSSGIYFYKLQTEYFTDIKKMIFTK